MEQISVNLIPSGIKGTCHASQFDIGRSIRFALLSGSNIYTLSGSETITMKIRKPDGTERTETLANTSSTYVDLVTNRDTCDQSGKYDCEITVTDGGVVIGSGNFTMEVEADSLDGIIVVKTASGAIASFSTSLPFPLNEAKFTLPYKAGGYTELKHYNSKTTPVFDLAPYLTRANTNTGNLALEKLVGLTVCFNQLAIPQDYTTSAYGLTITGISSTGEISISGTANASGYFDFGPSTFNIPIPTGHKVLLIGATDNVNFRLNGSYTYTTKDNPKIISAESGAVTDVVINMTLTNGETVNEIIKPQIFDLTAMFGTEVADYLYNLENG